MFRRELSSLIYLFSIECEGDCTVSCVLSRSFFSNSKEENKIEQK